MNYKTINILVIMFLLLLAGCSNVSNQIVTEQGKRNIKIEQPTQKDDAKEKTTSRKVGNTVELKNKYSFKEVEEFFNLKLNKIVKQLGPGYEEGTETIDEATVPLKVVTYRDTMSLFGMLDEDYGVSRIEFGDGIEINGLKNGMDFKQVQNILGKSTVEKTWIGNEESTAYKIEYDIGKLHIKVISYEEGGKNSYIAFEKKE